MTATTATSRSDEGFTLVEMLMAMLIMTVGLLGLLQSVNLAYRQSLADHLRQEAVMVAEQEMHKWQRLKFAAVTANCRSTLSRTIAGNTLSFTVDREQRELAQTSRRLKVAVEWNVKGYQASHELFAIKTR